MYRDAGQNTAVGDDGRPTEGSEPPDEAGTILPVILCGSFGIGLWPIARACSPRQFMPFVDVIAPPFQATLRYLRLDPLFGRVTVVASAETHLVVAEQFGRSGAGADILLELSSKGSCAAVAVAACRTFRSRPDAFMLVVPADHVVDDAAAFAAACRSAIPAARAGHVVMLGVPPERAAAGYGYVLAGSALPGHGPAAQVAYFAVKPDVGRAAELLERGALCHAGYLLFSADTMVAELGRHAPAVLAAAEAALDGAVEDAGCLRLDPASLAGAPEDTIDRAVLERTDRAAVVSAAFGWRDIGTWDAVWGASARDADGNAASGNTRLLDTRNSLVRTEGDLLTAVIGVEDVVVVSTPDAILVTSRDRAASVGGFVADLHLKRVPEAHEHRRMHRPWGWYQRVDAGTRFQVKRILVVPKGRLSLQKHHHRAEHWVVVRGTAEVTVNGGVCLVHENEAIHVPIGAVHRLTNPGKIPLELIEVQVGSYMGEDDIIRFDDDYGRE